MSQDSQRNYKSPEKTRRTQSVLKGVPTQSMGTKIKIRIPGGKNDFDFDFDSDFEPRRTRIVLNCVPTQSMGTKINLATYFLNPEH